MQLAEAVRQCSEVIVLVDTSLQIQYVNPSFELLFGYSMADVLGRDLSFLLPDALVQQPANAIEIGAFEGEKLRRAKDGRNIPVLLKVAPIRNGNGITVGLVGTMTDLTNIREVEQALRENENKYRLLFESADDGIFLQDASGFLDCNQKGADMYGLSKEETIGRSPADFSPERQPDGRLSSEVATEMIAAAMCVGNQCFEWQSLRADGVPFDVEVKLNRVEYRGAPCLQAIVRDITERKLAQEGQKLAALVYLNSNEAMTVTDANNRIIAINPAFTKLTGYTEDEVRDKNPNILNSGRQDDAFYRAMWDSLNSTGRWQGEIWNRRKNGEVYIEWLSINSIYNDDGAVHQRVAQFTDITERKNAEMEIWNQANFDTLTLLPNRRLFSDRLEQEIKKAQRDKSFTALLFIDLDHFKEVNDTLGHDVGDLLLVEATSRIKHCVRGSDTLARLGGDEFTVILSELNDFADTGRIAQNIIDRLSEPFMLSCQESFVSASVGIAFYPDDATNETELIKHADQAMYAAKNAGRGCFRYFTKAMQTAAELRMHLSGDLRHALEAHQFEVYYQPIVDLKTGDIHKAEALLRWIHPEHGLISPAAFIPIAEDTGTIHDIGDWVFMQAAEQVKRWQLLQGPGFQISVNKSPVQFIGESLDHNHWIDQLTNLKLPGSSIVVEITESLLMNTDTNVTDKLLRFRDAGMQVAIDDFGTGYSSLAYLKKFHIDYLKIDQSFTRNLAPDASDFALCEAIVVMAHKLGLKVIAEGVETEQQRDLLQQIDCDYGQGFLFSSAVPVEEFEKLLVNVRIV